VIRTLCLFTLFAALANLCQAQEASAADPFAAKELLNDCQSKEQFETGYCLGFIAGVIGAHHGKGDESYCPPKGVTLGQEKLIFVKYLNDHPEELHLEGASVFLRAVSKVFPCKE